MSPEELETTEGISRRKMIKRIGAGAAIAWTAPVLTSIRTPAFAQGSPGGGCDCDINNPCNVAIPCNNNDPNCNCWVNAAHNVCLCGSFVQFCGDCGSCPGGSDGECPSGSHCVDTCCGFTCAPACTPGACVGGGKKSSALRTTR
jgi:hypothetical protein